MAHREHSPVLAFDRYVFEIDADAILDKYCDENREPLPDAPEDLRRDLEKLVEMRRTISG